MERGPDAHAEIAAQKQRQDVPPFVEQLIEELGVDDDEAAELIADVVSRVWTSGAAFGASEVAAQAIERGVDLKLRIVRD